MIALLLAYLGLQVGGPLETRFELPNGLRVRVQEDRRRPVVLVQVTYKVGSLHESAGVTGIAHYVEHMLYRATRNVRNEDSYGYIDRIGGRYTGGTWPEVTRYSELVPSWALESALRITAERMTGALFDSLEFERERSNVIAETNGYADQDPMSAFQDALVQSAFELHPYRYNSNTWARDNLVLTRAQAYDWYRRHYGPNNAVLTVVGDVDADSVRALVERHFAPLARAPGSGRITVVEPPQHAEKRVVLRAPGVGPRLEILYHAPQASHRDFPALRVLSRALQPRLARALRAAGHDTAFALADSASQYPYLFRVTIPGRSGEDLEPLVAVVQREIDAIASGLTADELAAARAAAPARQAGSAESPGSGIPPRRSALSAIADSLTDLEAEEWEVGPALRARIERDIHRVTTADVSAYAGRWLRVSQRTVGLLLPGASDFEPRWSDDRPLAGDRPDIPPLTTPPAPRARPEPVPPRALEPLEPLEPLPARVPGTRRVLPNGVVLRAATIARPAAGQGTHVRVAFSRAADSARAAARFAADPAFRRWRATVSWARRDSAAGTGPLVIALASGEPSLDPARLTAAAASAFASLPRHDPREASAPRAHRPGEERVVRAEDPQVAIVASLPGVAASHPDRRALELLNYIVGVPSYGGRLGWALTKTGLTYSSAASTTFGMRDGRITFRTTANPANVDAVIQAIREVVDGVGERGVEAWELREAQAFMLGRAVLYGPFTDSDAAAIAAALVESEAAGLELLDRPAFSRAYLSVTLDDVNRAARAHYRAPLLRVTATGSVRPPAASVFPRGTFQRLFE